MELERVGAALFELAVHGEVANGGASGRGVRVEGLVDVVGVGGGESDFEALVRLPGETIGGLGQVNLEGRVHRYEVRASELHTGEHQLD